MKKSKTILITIFIFLLSINSYSRITSQTPPPPTGDWDIFDTTVINNSVIILTGNLTVYPTGSLTLDNVTLIMNCTFDGEFGITVNGTLNVINKSNITVFDSNYSYDFVYGIESRGNIINSVVEYCGYNSGGTYGLQIDSNNVTVNYSKIRYGYIGIWSGYSPSILNSTIEFNDFISISLGLTSKSIVSNNTIITNRTKGIYTSGSSSPIIKKNTIQSIVPPSIVGYYGINILDSSSPLIHNNTLIYMEYGIFCQDATSPIVTNNTIIDSNGGIRWLTSNSITVSGNKLINISKTAIGFYSPGTISNNLLIDNKIGIDIVKVNSAIIINCTILNSTQYALDIESNSHATLLNTTFNESNVFFNDMESTLTIQWFMNANVTNPSGDPIQGANVNVYNMTDDLVSSGITGSDGLLRGIVVIERIQNYTTNITHTPRKISVWNDTLAGNAQSFINESKTVNIVLNNGSFLNLEPGWNLVSLPRIQPDTYLPTVLQSIEGQYDAVQLYNVTDTSDQWKHNHISKPSYLNDLNDINHTLGVWVHVTDPGGATLVVFGDVLTSSQNISLYPGWNLVGYPSLGNKNRTDALNNIDFGTDVDAIWTYNATTQTWKEITASDYFEVGRGYWLHSMVTKTWAIQI